MIFIAYLNLTMDNNPSSVRDISIDQLLLKFNYVISIPPSQANARDIISYWLDTMPIFPTIEQNRDLINKLEMAVRIRVIRELDLVFGDVKGLDNNIKEMDIYLLVIAESIALFINKWSKYIYPSNILNDIRYNMKPTTEDIIQNIKKKNIDIKQILATQKVSDILIEKK